MIMLTEVEITREAEELATLCTVVDKLEVQIILDRLVWERIFEKIDHRMADAAKRIGEEADALRSPEGRLYFIEKHGYSIVSAAHWAEFYFELMTILESHEKHAFNLARCLIAYRESRRHALAHSDAGAWDANPFARAQNYVIFKVLKEQIVYLDNLLRGLHGEYMALREGAQLLYRHPDWLRNEFEDPV